MSEETERVTVKTYVPAYQRDRWRQHAEDLDMSLSEFVRTMTQAGRRGFEVEPIATDAMRGEPSDDRTDPEGDALEELILGVLADGPASWDELLEAATGDIEGQLDTALAELQAEDRLRYSGQEGGYVLSE